MKGQACRESSASMSTSSDPAYRTRTSSARCATPRGAPPVRPARPDRALLPQGPERVAPQQLRSDLDLRKPRSVGGAVGDNRGTPPARRLPGDVEGVGERGAGALPDAGPRHDPVHQLSGALGAAPSFQKSWFKVATDNNIES